MESHRAVLPLRPMGVPSPETVCRLQPETPLAYRRLMAAVLEDAVRVIQYCGPVRDRESRRLLADTIAWIASDENQWPFSFVVICQALDLEPDAIRRALLHPRRAVAVQDGMLLPLEHARHAS